MDQKSLEQFAALEFGVGRERSQKNPEVIHELRDAETQVETHPDSTSSSPRKNDVNYGALGL